MFFEMIGITNEIPRALRDLFTNGAPLTGR